MPTPAFRFDGTNPTAQRVAAKAGSRFVSEVTAEVRAALRTLVARAIAEGIPPYDAARLIAGMVGLTTRQQLAVLSYREQLIESGLPITRVDKLVDRYSDRKLRERAETIARTETMSALNEGALEASRQAQKEGLLGDSATKTWIVTPDERLCELCAPMEGVTVPLNSAYSTPAGLVQGPPLHPNCRCTSAVNA